MVEPTTNCIVQLLENRPSFTFWSSLSQALEKHTRDAARSKFGTCSSPYHADDSTILASTFMQQTLGNGYPRLLRLFHEFFAKIAVHTDTVYTATHQRCVSFLSRALGISRLTKPHRFSPETYLILRALSTFESHYLARTSARLTEVISSAFPSSVSAFSPISRTPSGSGSNTLDTIEGVNISRAISNELDTAKFDPLLVRSVAKHVASALDMLRIRADTLVSRDRQALVLGSVGALSPGAGAVATREQISNAGIGSCLWTVTTRVEKLKEEYPEGVGVLLKTPVKVCASSRDRPDDQVIPCN